MYTDILEEKEEVIKIKTNDRFDKLTNLDIKTHYRDKKFYVSRQDILSSLAYWLTFQSPYDAPDIWEAIINFNEYLLNNVFSVNEAIINKDFSYDELKKVINTKVFESIPSIEKLNDPKISSGKGYKNRHIKYSPDYDFIDLDALARNVFFMVLRNYITDGGFE